MKSKFNINAEVLRLIRMKRMHFWSFRQAAQFRQKKSATGNTSHLRQFKTEKWLQAELIHHFWSKRIRAIPEFSKEKWDIYVAAPGKKSGFLLALKCLADSGQSAQGDFDGGGPNSPKLAGISWRLDGEN